MAIRTLRRADAALPQAHRREAVPLPPLRALLLSLRPLGAPRQAPRVARPNAARRHQAQSEQETETLNRNANARHSVCDSVYV